jgi:hypothetical protein
VSVGCAEIRLPRLMPFEPVDHLSGDRLAFYNGISEQCGGAAEVFRRAGIRYTDAFLGYSTMGSDCTFKRWYHLLQTWLSDPGLVSAEIMVHPGYVTLSRPVSAAPPEVPVLSAHAGCGSGADEFSMSTDRELEMQLLLSEELQTYLAQQSVQLAVKSNAQTTQRPTSLSA